ncbi:hypothetical protein [Paenibacillus sp. SAFN-117]|uniref:hypothetical protein n=1 Tax=Paenibacillus sp. SAFN-117 TaxID=3436860 RepID=UPI003F8236B9
MSGVYHVGEVAVQKLAGEHIIAERNGEHFDQNGYRNAATFSTTNTRNGYRGRYILYRECQCGGEDGRLYIKEG